MAQNKNTEPANTDDDFTVLIGDLLTDEAFKNTVESIRPTAAQQRKRLADIKARHYAQWQEAGILGVVTDRLLRHEDGDNYLGGTAVHFQRHEKKRRDGSVVEVWELAVSKTKATTSADGLHRDAKSWTGFMPLAETEKGVITPADGFTAEQVALVGQQVAELDALREDKMGLPDLEWSLVDIFDRSTALMARPKS